MIHSLYVHIPFCEQICHYCDFNKFFLENQPIDDYISCLIKEMEMSTAQFQENPQLKTIYIGGGTPTALSTKQLARVLNGIKESFTLLDSVEYTVEVNPGSADREKMEMLASFGVNRLSIGAQTFDHELLKAINRDHQANDVEKTIELSRAAGIDNLSVDLMFGLPNQSLKQWENTLERAINLPITHISAYGLKIEERTVFYQRYRQGKLALPEQEEEAIMYEMLCTFLKEKNFIQYEISNFAKAGFESKHNLTYWLNNHYFAAGAGAHSYINNVRTANIGPLPKYMKTIENNERPIREETFVSKQEKMEEEMFLGLRMIKGVSKKNFYERYKMEVEEAFPEVVMNMKKRGLLQESEGFISLTKGGLLLANEVFEAFIQV